MLNIIKININIININKSLKINVGFKLIWSKLLLIFIGLDDFFICKIIIWIIDINIIINAIKKWIEKNRLIKILSINLFPQINNIKFFPKIGITLKKLVITVLAQ